MTVRCPRWITFLAFCIPLLAGCSQPNASRSDRSSSEVQEGGSQAPSSATDTSAPQATPPSILDDPEVVADLKEQNASLTFDDSQNVVGVSFPDSSNTIPLRDRHLALLQRLPRLRQLRLFGSEITDSQMRYISELGSLQELTLEATSVTDEGLRSIRELPKLSKVELPNCQITDAGLIHVAQLPKLRNLQLFGCPITNGIQ